MAFIPPVPPTYNRIHDKGQSAGMRGTTGAQEARPLYGSCTLLWSFLVVELSGFRFSVSPFAPRKEKGSECSSSFCPDSDTGTL